MYGYFDRVILAAGRGQLPAFYFNLCIAGQRDWLAFYFSVFVSPTNGN